MYLVIHECEVTREKPTTENKLHIAMLVRPLKARVVLKAFLFEMLKAISFVFIQWP
jgi:hypothetical protein